MNTLRVVDARRSSPRPICYRTHRTWWDRVQPAAIALVAVLVLIAIALGVVALIARLHATDAQLESAYLQGLAAGQRMCRSD